MDYNDYTDEFFDEVPKYRKKKGKRKSKKSDHRHIYKEYIGLVMSANCWDSDQYFPITTCDICGRVDKISFGFVKKTENGRYSVIDDLDEIKRQNPTLEIKKFDKFPW